MASDVQLNRVSPVTAQPHNYQLMASLKSVKQADGDLSPSCLSICCCRLSLLLSLPDGINHSEALPLWPQDIVNKLNNYKCDHLQRVIND